MDEPVLTMQKVRIIILPASMTVCGLATFRIVNLGEFHGKMIKVSLRQAMG